MIFSDIDNTLVYKGSELSEAMKQLLKKLVSDGVFFVPATGRTFYGVRDLIAMGLCKYVVSSGGAAVYDLKEQRIIHEELISYKDAADMLRYVKNKYGVDADVFEKDYCVTTKEIEKTVMHFFYDGEEEKDPQEQVDDHRTFVEGDLADCLENNTLDVQKVNIYFDPEIKEKIMPDLQERYPHLYVASAWPCSLEITSRAASKGEAMLWLADHLHIDPKSIIAFGDNSNDSDMLQKAGIGVAVGNAVEECKKAADYVTDNVWDDGARKALEHFLYE